jgi:hypothetical protein
LRYRAAGREPASAGFQLVDSLAARFAMLQEDAIRHAAMRAVVIAVLKGIASVFRSRLRMFTYAGAATSVHLRGNILPADSSSPLWTLARVRSGGYSLRMGDSRIQKSCQFCHGERPHAYDAESSSTPRL